MSLYVLLWDQTRCSDIRNKLMSEFIVSDIGNVKNFANFTFLLGKFVRMVPLGTGFIHTLTIEIV